jgi:inosine triphosphate pyrophosphatase
MLSSMICLSQCSNKNKLREIRAILGDSVEANAIDLLEIQGTSEEIVTEKAKHAAKLLNCTVLVDDTSLELNALGRLPGPYIKAFVDKIGADGLFKMLHGFEDKTAASQCIFALCEPNGEPRLFVGRTNGTIVQPRGPTHFGFDPCFQVCAVCGYGVTTQQYRALLSRTDAPRHLLRWMQARRTRSRTAGEL